MPKPRVFISSVQVEFASERQALHDYILADPLLGRFFEPFLFEHLPALDQRGCKVWTYKFSKLLKKLNTAGSQPWTYSIASLQFKLLRMN